MKEAQLPEGWPKGGAITFLDYKMRYRENTPIVLNGLSFFIQAGEKLGIVGRTGSGEETYEFQYWSKEFMEISSLILLFFVSCSFLNAWLNPTRFWFWFYL